MARTKGYVGTIEVETRGTARIWFSLTEQVNDDNWVKIAGQRAWFTLNLEESDRPLYMAELSLIKDAMRDGLEIQVTHQGVEPFYKRSSGDTYTVTGVRVLRAPMRFS
ncbi:MAG TPA: hypothetical protein ENJ80_02245 [Gammaproteobacteria bacterium]|nr:hypothetical protein [Gammaproteobacteria bacterium]